MGRPIKLQGPIINGAVRVFPNPNHPPEPPRRHWVAKSPGHAAVSRGQPRRACAGARRTRAEAGRASDRSGRARAAEAGVRAMPPAPCLGPAPGARVGARPAAHAQCRRLLLRPLARSRPCPRVRSRRCTGGRTRVPGPGRALAPVAKRRYALRSGGRSRASRGAPAPALPWRARLELAWGMARRGEPVAEHAHVPRAGHATPAPAIGPAAPTPLRPASAPWLPRRVLGLHQVPAPGLGRPRTRSAGCCYRTHSPGAGRARASDHVGVPEAEPGSQAPIAPWPPWPSAGTRSALGPESRTPWCAGERPWPSAPASRTRHACAVTWPIVAGLIHRSHKVLHPNDEREEEFHTFLLF
jgi:hypothetical protein